MMEEKIKILQKGAKILRQRAEEVPLDKIKSAEIKRILKNMSLLLDGEEDGVALAAPQIGISKRIFIVSPNAFMQHLIKADEKEKNTARHKILKTENIIFINPEITRLSKEKEELDEGCLSVRPLYGKVKRASRATIRAFNERGELFTRGAGGLLAQIFQHETDHLDGILFIDTAKDLRPAPQEKNI